MGTGKVVTPTCKQGSSSSEELFPKSIVSPQTLHPSSPTHQDWEYSLRPGISHLLPGLPASCPCFLGVFSIPPPEDSDTEVKAPLLLPPQAPLPCSVHIHWPSHQQILGTILALGSLHRPLLLPGCYSSRNPWAFPEMHTSPLLPLTYFSANV